MTGKRILVTGGTGFLGRNVVRLLVKKGYQVTVLDTVPFDASEILPDLEAPQVSTVVGSTLDGKLVDQAMKDQQAIIHLADPPSFLIYEESPISSTVSTLHGFLNVLEAMKKHGVKKMVYTSTSTVYKGNTPPFVEDMTLDPPDLKSLSKKMKEEVARHYSKRPDGPVAIGLRPFTVYGGDEYTKGGYASVVSLFVWTMLEGNVPIVWGDGNQTRDYIWIDDATNAFLLALEKDIPTQEFNVGTGKGASFNDLIRIINTQLKTDLQPEYVSIPADTYAMHMLGDMARAKNILGLKPEVGLEEGIGRLIAQARIIMSQKTGLGAAQKTYEQLNKPKS